MNYLLTGCLVLCAAILWLFLHRKRKPPGPCGLPILGYLPWLDASAPYLTLTDLSRKYGSIYGLYLGSVYTVVLTDHRVIRKVLAKEVFSGRAPLYVTHGIMNGYGIICAEGELWKDQRKFVSNCLRNFGAIKNSPRKGKFQEVIKKGVEEFVAFLKDDTPGCDVDSHPHLRHCLGNVMNEIVFGRTWSKDDKQWQWLQTLQEEGTKHIGVAGPMNFLPFLRYLPSYKRTMQYLIAGKIKTHKLYKTLITEQSRKLGSDSQNIINSFLLERIKKLDAEDPKLCFYDDQQFFHILGDIFGAGLDTTLTTLTWFFIFMAAFPVEQTRLQEELDSALNGRTPDVVDMGTLPFTEAAIAETQRIRSVVPVGIPHGCLADTEIEGYFIPKGTMIVPLQWAVHMNPHHWDKPNLYNPSRFLDTDGSFVKPDYFIPFQTGKRMCVGDELARMLLFLFGTTVLQKFRISCPIDEEIDLAGECGITLTPRKHCLVFAERRK